MQTYAQEKALEDQFGLAETAPSTTSLQTIASLKAALDMFEGGDADDLRSAAALKSVAKEELRMMALGARLLHGNTRGSVALQSLCGTGASGAARAGKLAKAHAAKRSVEEIMDSAGNNGPVNLIDKFKRSGMNRFQAQGFVRYNQPPPARGGV